MGGESRRKNKRRFGRIALGEHPRLRVSWGPARSGLLPGSAGGLSKKGRSGRIWPPGGRITDGR